MPSNIIQIKEYMPPREKTILKVLVFPEKQAPVKPLKEIELTLKELHLKHPDLPESNSSHKDRVLF